jgi:shikimate dehydrogenase
MELTGLDGEYTKQRADAEVLGQAISRLRAGELDGINVTMPLKRAAAGLCDRLDPQAQRTGSVNTIVRVGDRAIGHDTDVIALKLALEEMPETAPLLILGAGGAASSAAVAAGSRPTYVAGRRPGALQALAEAANQAAAEVPWGVPVVGAVVVNATPLGMAGEALPPGLLAVAGGLVDLVYGPKVTPAVEMAADLGIPAVDGLSHLVRQAAAGFQLWTSRAGVEQAMMEAAKRTQEVG